MNFVLSLVFAAVLTAAPTGGSDPRITARLVLPTTTMEAGSEMSAMVVVHNATGGDVTVTGCLNLFAVALGNAKVDPQELLAWPMCAQAITIPAGTTRYPVTVAARYVACFGSSRPPICVGDRPPPLPPGTYKARLYQNPHDAVRAPKPVTVRVKR
jgi:hypothetical protein